MMATEKTTLWPGALAAGAAFAVFHTVCWTSLDEFNHRDEDNLWNLLAQHTPRHSLIVMEDNFLPGETLNASRMADGFDRKIIAESEWNRNRATYAVSGKECFLLTHKTLAGDQNNLVAETINEPRWADKIMGPMFDFYRSKISRRAAGDRLILAPKSLLYKL